MGYLGFTEETDVSLSSEGSTLYLDQFPDGPDHDTVAMPVSVAFKVADLMLREFPGYFTREGE